MAAYQIVYRLEPIVRMTVFCHPPSLMDICWVEGSKEEVGAYTIKVKPDREMGESSIGGREQYGRAGYCSPSPDLRRMGGVPQSACPVGALSLPVWPVRPWCRHVSQRADLGRHSGVCILRVRSPILLARGWREGRWMVLGALIVALERCL